MQPLFIIKPVLPLLAMLLVICATAQSRGDNYIKDKKYYPAIRFIANAPAMLPALYKAGKLADIKNFADNWGQSPAPSDEFIFAIKVLLAVENNNLSIHQMPWDYMRLLDDFAREIAMVNNDPKTFSYYLNLPGSQYRYDATADALKLLQFIQAWAKDVMAAAPVASNTTTFVCGVFAGTISNPSSYFALNRSLYQEMNDYENSIDSVRQQCFVIKRNSPARTAHLLTGIWLPNGNLATLGVHPGIGLQFGRRNKMNEFDITWSFRFLAPGPHTYTVLRQDTLYNSNYYDGGYIGFDYTRYIIHRASFEAGFIGGIGYDYFDAFNGISGNDDGHNYQPYNIGSLDVNFGMHLKYFIHRGPSIGIQAKYHCINYVNSGGTDLSGNAVTIDFSFGAN